MYMQTADMYNDSAGRICSFTLILQDGITFSHHYLQHVLEYQQAKRPRA